jgi:tryptophanyl-tRNA synthetase
LTNAIGIDDPKNPDECNVYNILKLFLNEEEDLNIRKKYNVG